MTRDRHIYDSSSTHELPTSYCDTDPSQPSRAPKTDAGNRAGQSGPVLHVPRALFSFRLRLRHVKSRDHKHRNVHANVSRCDTRLRADLLAPSIHSIAMLPSPVLPCYTSKATRPCSVPCRSRHELRPTVWTSSAS